MYLLGYDIGSSSIKAALVKAGSGDVAASVQSPEAELDILAVKPGWAEQDPETWWDHVCLATRRLLREQNVDPKDILAIGIAYQMHGLVAVGKDLAALRPSIIWCDSRAVEIGERAFDGIGHEKCLSRLLNSPANFTASKLKWVKDNEPEIYSRIHKIMLPGEYVAMRLTGEIATTPGGLSEGIFYDFTENGVSLDVLDHFGFSRDLIPQIKPTFSLQGELTDKAASETGLRRGIPVTYRAGDQPNNALSLNVLQPGEVAATGGTSGVVYGVVDRPVYDPESRVNGFAHVNHNKDRPRIGILLCINGAGIQYKWMRENIGLNKLSYKEMDRLAGTAPVGSEGLRVFPFGNGAERMLGNKSPGGLIGNIQFNLHTPAHCFRAALEGIAFSFVYGMGVVQELGVEVSVIRVGNDNLFRSQIFAETIAALRQCSIELVETTGAVGAAKASGVAVGVFGSVEEAVGSAKVVRTFEPGKDTGAYTDAYKEWEYDLEKLI